MSKKIIVLVIVLLAGIQFIRTKKANNEERESLKTDFITKMPDNIKASLQNACFDCHSNETELPFYADIQPIGWLIDFHIEKGKNHLNFSIFSEYPKEEQIHLLNETIEAIEEGWMPLKSYSFMHKEAKLSELEKKEIVNWANETKKQINNQDILVDTLSF